MTDSGEAPRPGNPGSECPRFAKPANEKFPIKPPPASEPKAKEPAATTQSTVMTPMAMSEFIMTASTFLLLTIPP